MKKSIGVVVAIAVVLGLVWRFYPATESPSPNAIKASTPGPSGNASRDQVAVSPQQSKTSPGPGGASGSASAKGPHVTESAPFLPAGPVKGYIASLAAQAIGPPSSPQAAYLLYSALNACRWMAAMSAQEVAALRAKSGANPVTQPPDCGGVTKEEMAETDKWLKFAADQGSERAQVQFAQRYLENFKDLQQVLRNPEEVVAYREQATRYLQSGVAVGNWDAMWFLSRSYEEGTLTERNLQLAYAYRYAIQRTGGYPQTIERNLADVSQQMTREEVQAAQRLGEQIASQCCSRK